ncbi:single hybrid motif-containing protein, partial [Vararia minispora EC-137]
LHTSAAHRAITNFQMPAMSPTMTEGGISSWKVKEGQSFAAGDVLLEIETDKATIDVEAPEDGVMGKIVAQDGAKNIPVGKIIALLVEEGDDISNLEVPREESAPVTASSTPSMPPPSQTSSAAAGPGQPKRTMHIEADRLFPSVMRLMQEHDFSLDKVKGTGLRGMITKGDVLAFLGKASSPTGTFKETRPIDAPAPKAVSIAKPEKPFDGAAVRRLIVEGMQARSLKARNTAAPQLASDFDSIIADYLPPPPLAPS